jgi:DNA-binding NarL/FixJ family response regulator
MAALLQAAWPEASEEAFKRHNTNIFGKLGASNRTEAVAKARESGLL